jgi:hypothetical protein
VATVRYHLSAFEEFEAMLIFDIQCWMFRLRCLNSKLFKNIEHDKKTFKGRNSCTWYNMCMLCRLHDIAFLTGEEEELY